MAACESGGERRLCVCGRCRAEADDKGEKEGLMTFVLGDAAATGFLGLVSK